MTNKYVNKMVLKKLRNNLLSTFHYPMPYQIMTSPYTIHYYESTDNELLVMTYTTLPVYVVISKSVFVNLK